MAHREKGNNGIECPKCHFGNPSDSKFCKECGTQLISSDEIIARLYRLEGFKVIPRTSMMRYKNTDKDIKEIGQELDVAAILEGSIRKEKDDIRVIATLINVADSSQL